MAALSPRSIDLVDLDALVLTDEAALIAHVQPYRIRRWAADYPEVMPVRQRDRFGRPRYRLGDVIAVEHATRTGLRVGSLTTR